MEKLIGWALALIAVVALLACLLHMDIVATDRLEYNNGIHRKCGGQWVRGDRAVTVNWCYCDKCGCDKTFR